ncbi:MAG: response regulator transcription factor [Gammaproteobacteria bacterium]
MILLCSANEGLLQRWQQGLPKLAPVRKLHTGNAIGPCLGADNPQLMLLHISLPGLNGIQGVAVLRRRCPDLKLMIFSDIPTEEEGMALFKLGVHGYANAYMSPELFSEAIKVVQSGEVWVGRKLMQRLIADLTGANPQPAPAKAINKTLRLLTEREIEIALLISKASSNKRIASVLKITERTVKAHLSSIFRKTGAHDRLQLALQVNGQVTQDTAEELVSSHML